jgi:hypothetical protein
MEDDEVYFDAGEPEVFEEELVVSAQVPEQPLSQGTDAIPTSTDAAQPHTADKVDKVDKVDKAALGHSRSSRNTKVLTDLRDRLQKSNHPCIKDGRIPWGLLSHPEFAVCMRGALIKKQGKSYYFTEKGLKFLAGEPAPEVEDGPKDITYKPRVAATPSSPSLQNSSSAHPRPSNSGSGRNSNNQRMVVPTPMAIGPAQGANQVVLENVIYQETNKLGHHSLILIGRDGLGQERRVLRGIPQSVARALVEDPLRFQKKVFQIDDRGNFIGFLLLPNMESNPTVQHESSGPEI